MTAGKGKNSARKIGDASEKGAAAYPLGIREEELKNRVAAEYFAKYDCARIVGNIDFCVSARRKDDPRQMTFAPEAPLFWAEAKNHPTDVCRMLAQLILTIKGERNADVEPPKFIGCFDTEKIAFVEYHYILPVFNINDFNWTQTPSAVDDKTVETVRGTIPQERIVTFRFGADDAEIKAFIRRNLASGDTPALATPIDRNNFTFIYQKWRASVMPHIDAPWDVLKRKYALYDRDFFLAEMNIDDNGTPELADDRPAVDFYITFNASAQKPYCIRRKNEDEFDISMSFGFKAGGMDAYAEFWRRYKRPPKREYWDFIVSRLDLLVPQDVRERKGSFFTPAIWVQKSQEYLAAVLGENWQDEYDVWDCSGGTGNMEVGLTNRYRIWVSTLDQQDVEVMKERIKNGANLLESHVFQFDFLNDPFDRLPKGLQDIINDPARRRKLVIYINPPYAEAATTRAKTGTGENKPGVAASHSPNKRYKPIIGAAVNELFALFLMRIHDEIPGCIVGQFSKLKHVQSPNFKVFREAFHGTLEKCFIVPADTFDNVKGKFPIGFFVWRLTGRTGFQPVPLSAQATGGTPVVPVNARDARSPSDVFTSAVADVYDHDGVPIDTKTLLAVSRDQVINTWLHGSFDPKSEPIGWLRFVPNDFQNNSGVYITVKPNESDVRESRVAAITGNNIGVMCVYIAVRHCMEATWLNDRDQFLFPNDGWKEDLEFQSDCLLFTLFHGQNRVKSADGVNHWIPFTEEEVGAKDCFTSHFMSDWLGGKRLTGRTGVPPVQGELVFGESDARTPTGGTGVPPVQKNANGQDARSPSKEAKAVMDAGRELWRYYHAQPDANPNASYYDIRLHFQGSSTDAKGKVRMNSESSDAKYTELLANLRTAMKRLARRIEPKVYEYGFLKK